MKQPGCSSGRWRTAVTVPGIKPDMMVVTAGGYKRCFGAHALHQCKSEYITIEAERALQISDLQVNVADANLRIDRVASHSGSRLLQVLRMLISNAFLRWLRPHHHECLK